MRGTQYFCILQHFFHKKRQNACLLRNVMNYNVKKELDMTKNGAKRQMTVGEVAKKMGVTVRTLQYYHREGLFSPSCISDGGRRLYCDKDLIRLHQILMLKSLGFSLDEIKTRVISVDTPQKAINVLCEQEKSIQLQLDRLTASLDAIKKLKYEIEKMQTVDFAKYADIIANLQMGNRCYGLIKHFDDKLLDYCHGKFDKNTSANFINRFNGILDRTEQCLEYGVAPESEQGQAVAKEFWQLITEFTGGDTDMLTHLMNFGQSQETEDFQESLKAFLEPALDVYFKNLGKNPF